MSLQIKDIIIYNTKGDSRVVSFKLGSLNIITGRSKTGKTSIIDIVNYCLGRSAFNVPEGVIRDNVSWYAVKYQLDNTQILVAKPAPLPSAQSQSGVYLQIAEFIDNPDYSSLKINTNDEAVIENISRLIGINPNINLPDAGESREPLEGSIKHTRYYLFQDQNLVANRALLFYRQHEEFMQQAIKNTLPYFLDAIQDDYLKIENELRSARRRLKLELRKLREAETIINQRLVLGRNLLFEALQIGLIRIEIDNLDDEQVLNSLRDLHNWKPDVKPSDRSNQIPKLQSDINIARKEFQNTIRRLHEATDYAQETEGYSSEAERQLLRLESINLVDISDAATHKCPLCTTNLLFLALAQRFFRRPLQAVDLRAPCRPPTRR